MRCRKRNFKTKRQAEKGIGMVQALNHSKGQTHRDKGLHVYECKDCKAWHIGHKQRQPS